MIRKEGMFQVFTSTCPIELVELAVSVKTPDNAVYVIDNQDGSFSCIEFLDGVGLPLDSEAIEVELNWTVEQLAPMLYDFEDEPTQETPEDELIKID